MSSKRDLIGIRLQIIAAKEEAQLERERTISFAREAVRAELLAHNRVHASRATSRGAASAYADFIGMADKMRAGGYHRTRLHGGRGLDG